MLLPRMEESSPIRRIRIFSSASWRTKGRNGLASIRFSRRSTMSPAALDIVSAAEATCRMPASLSESSLVLLAISAIIRI